MRKVLFILGQLTDEDVEWLGQVGQRERVEAGTELIREGVPIDAVYFVLEGRLVVSRKGERLRELEMGEILGDMSFVDKSPPSATVRAVTGSTVLRVARDDLALRMEKDPTFAAHFYKAIAVFLSDRVRTAEARAQSGGADAAQADELDENVLDTVALAGDRFDRLLRGSAVR
jgi:CRP-like cAMP-binding protein